MRVQGRRHGLTPLGGQSVGVRFFLSSSLETEEPAGIFLSRGNDIVEESTTHLIPPSQCQQEFSTGMRLGRAWLCGILLCMVSFVSVGATLFPAEVSNITWEVLDAGYPEAVFEDVAFVDSMHGWVVGREYRSGGSDLLVLHTTDGGVTWTPQYAEPDGYATTIEVVDGQTVWLNGGEGRLIHTIDGGKTWLTTDIIGSTAGLSTVAFLNRTHGWTANMGVLYKTMDGGESWQPVEGWTFGLNPSQIAILPSGDMWACGPSGPFHSTDGGDTWTNRSRIGGLSMSFVSSEEGWMSCLNSLAHMADGENWVRLIAPGILPWFNFMGPSLTDIEFVDKSNGWVVGQEPAVMYTPDGGANWYRQTVSVSIQEIRPYMNAMQCINETHGWAVGSLGTILRTTTANDLGTRLFGGSDDPISFAAIATIVAAVAGGGVLYERGKRKILARMPNQGSDRPANGATE